MSLAEINEFSVADFISFLDIYFFVDSGKVRKATQKDIDKLLG